MTPAFDTGVSQSTHDQQARDRVSAPTTALRAAATRSPARLGWGRRYLLVEPSHFEVSYKINPWMREGVDRARALRQWRRLRDLLVELGASVEVMPDQPRLPDMAFAMNAGFVIDDAAVVSRFRHPERQPEEAYWREWFEGAGYRIVDLGLAPQERFEAGDAFLVDGVLVGAWGWRSDRGAIDALARTFDLDLVSVRLIDDRFYHFDTCFCPLGRGHALAYAGAMDAYDANALTSVVPNALWLTEREALTFAANSLTIGDQFITAGVPPRVKEYVESSGFTVHTLELGEFHLSG